MKTALSIATLILVLGSHPRGVFGQSADATSAPTPPIRRSGPNIPGPGQKVINQARGNIYNPVSIQSILFDGHPIKPGDPFPAGEDWLKHIEIVIKNNSQKNLIQASVRIDFRELGSPVLLWASDVGRIPEHQLYEPSGEKISRVQTQPAITVAPGDTVTIPIKDNYEALKRFLENRTAISKVDACGIDLNAFYFADDTRWSAGSYAKADQARPGQYLRITRNEFNGSAASQ